LIQALGGSIATHPFQPVMMPTISTERIEYAMFGGVALGVSFSIVHKLFGSWAVKQVRLHKESVFSCILPCNSSMEFTLRTFLTLLLIKQCPIRFLTQGGKIQKLFIELQRKSFHMIGG
jgi:hypothetical protein